MSESPETPAVKRLIDSGVVRKDSERLTFSFGNREGSLQRVRSEFADMADLVSFLKGFVNPSRTNEDRLRGTVQRRGKYARFGDQGKSELTSGDPILDLITDEHGDVTISGRRVAAGRAQLRNPKNRIGGIRTMDHTDRIAQISEHHLAQAVMGVGPFVLTECHDGLVALASSNPSEMDYFLNGAHLRFKAWRNSGFLKWEMGAEIETWGHDFDSASIESRYLGEAYMQTCTVWKTDSDSTTDDDYLDEYEWGTPGTEQPIRVESLCTARWQGQDFSAWVTAGDECFEV